MSYGLTSRWEIPVGIPKFLYSSSKNSTPKGGAVGTDTLAVRLSVELNFYQNVGPLQKKVLPYRALVLA